MVGHFYRREVRIKTLSSKSVEGVVKTTYGIKCEEMAVNDVSPNKKEVTELIDRLNKYELSPCHLQDVIEDFI